MIIIYQGRYLVTGSQGFGIEIIYFSKKFLMANRHL